MVRWADAKSPRYDRTVKLKIVLEPSEEGGFTVFVPALPGCVSEGETREEALANIREAIELYLEPSETELSAGPGSKVEELVF
jgi:predicted RNase H-like HicB family nuclease